jgi:hypothetical protein
VRHASNASTLSRISAPCEENQPLSRREIQAATVVSETP